VKTVTKNSNNTLSREGLSRKRLPRFVSREGLIAVTVVLLFVGAAFFFGLRWMEWNVTFHPLPYSADQAWSLPKGAEEVWFRTSDGARLNGWFFRSTEQPSSATVIYFHGNAGNINHLGWVGERLGIRGLDVLLVDYRGYGRSEGGVVDERSIYADGDAAYDYVVQRLGIAPGNVVLYGQSLGTTVAVDIASRQQCRALILESGLSSASSIVSDIFPSLPRRLHFLLRNRFDSAEKLAKVRCPVLITHGDPDPVLRTEEGRKLFAAAHEPKKLIIFPGAGHNVFGSQGDPYLKLIADFIRDSGPPKK
jgi:uncharacterized protein